MLASPVLPACGSSVIPATCATTADSSTGAPLCCLCAPLSLAPALGISAVIPQEETTLNKEYENYFVKLLHLTKILPPKRGRKWGSSHAAVLALPGLQIQLLPCWLLSSHSSFCSKRSFWSSTTGLWGFQLDSCSCLLSFL